MQDRKIFIKLLLIISIIFIFKLSVKASVNGQLSMTYVDGYYYTMTGGNSGYMSYNVPFYTINDEVVYCIEPGVNITNYAYVGEVGLENSPYSLEINKKMQLIGYYGYNYPGHKTINYRMATQALIWNLVGNRVVDFWTQQYGYGTYIDVSNEKKEIMKLVDNHYVKPSFSGSSYKGLLNQELVLEDTNNVLSSFKVENDYENEVRIEGNKLYIVPKVSGNSRITLSKKSYDDEVTMIFTGEYDKGSQKLGKFRINNEVGATFDLNVLRGRVTIEKVDKTTGLSLASGDATLAGAVYGVYNSYDELICELVTDKYGNATSDYIDDSGNLKIKEIKAPKGYQLDETVYNFKITLDNLNPTVKVYEEVIEKELVILKQYGKKSTDIYYPEENIEFEIYLNSTNKLVKTIKTDVDGYARAILPYGEYIVRQKNTTSDYTKAEDTYVVIDDTSPDTIELNIYNYAIEARLKVIKTDSESGKVIPLAGIKFKIKDLDNGEYVCHTTTYPDANKICEYTTDESGMFVTQEALVGNYVLEEVKEQIVYGYVWNKEKIKFHIGTGEEFYEDESGRVYTIKFPNTRVKGKVKIEKVGEEVVLENNTFKYLKKNLDGVKFGVYANEDIKVNGEVLYTKDSLVREGVTNNKGYTIIDNLELGKYYLMELVTDKNHVLDSKKYEFELKYQDQYTEEVGVVFQINNHYKTGGLELIKIDAEDEQPLPRALIEVYTDKDELIYWGWTNEEGKINIDNLFIGNFYLVEKKAPVGYVLNKERIYFKISENDEIVKLKLPNKEITGTLEFFKLDSSNNHVLSNTEIGVYNLLDELVTSGITDKDGKIVIDNLEYGKYYIKEQKAPVGYILSEDKIYFEILKDKEVVNVVMTNDRMVEVPNTIKEDYTNIVVVITIGLGCILLLISIFKKRNR